MWSLAAQPVHKDKGDRFTGLNKHSIFALQFKLIHLQQD
jgi:hypothetical protein